MYSGDDMLSSLLKDDPIRSALPQVTADHRFRRRSEIEEGSCGNCRFRVSRDQSSAPGINLASFEWGCEQQSDTCSEVVNVVNTPTEINLWVCDRFSA